MTPAELTKWVEAEINRNEFLKVIYFQAVDARSMQQIDSWEDSERVQGCVAVQAGNVRLIDNIKLK
jgi:pantoate--beta-alanine ligase